MLKVSSLPYAPLLWYANLRCLQRLTVERHLPPNGALTRSFPVDILIQHVYVFISYLENIPDRPNIEPQIPTLLFPRLFVAGRSLTV